MVFIIEKLGPKILQLLLKGVVPKVEESDNLPHCWEALFATSGSGAIVHPGTSPQYQIIF